MKKILIINTIFALFILSIASIYYLYYKNLDSISVIPYTSTNKSAVSESCAGISTTAKTSFFLPQKIAKKQLLPEGFVYLNEIVPEIHVDMRYSTHNNFTGRIVPGYYSNSCILTYEAAIALKEVQNTLREDGIGLIVYDGYRPQSAVDSFVKWVNDPLDQLMKESYYPDIDKSKLISLGYIARRSAHSRGSTVDLSLICLQTGLELDMGGPFDFFGEKSGYYYKNLTDIQKQNRALLRTTMENKGFRFYSKEWWHFTLQNEPFPNTFFDFPVR
ncbi:UNVERIFIED_CONTAM: D-Ala-D-Ala dipeptidase VanX [Acetivibrio alkalicellulosi]